MRDQVLCPGCSVTGKVRIIHKEIVIFWKRGDLWWRDHVSERDLEEGFTCGACKAPDSQLLWVGIAKRKKK